MLLISTAFGASAAYYDFCIDGIYYRLSGSEARVVAGDIPNSGSVEIPAEVFYDGRYRYVGTICEDAFKNCKDLTSVTLPEGLLRITECAFAYTGLKSIRIPDTVTIIYDSFVGCSSLESVYIGSSVKEIHFNAFKDCENIQNVYVKDIDTWCNIDFGYHNSNPMNSIKYEDRYTKLYVDGEIITDLVIPEGITKIGRYSFYFCQQFTSVSIPNTVTEIGREAFYGCLNLSGLQLPNSVTTIGPYAFGFCFRIKDLQIPNSVTTIGERAFLQGRMKSIVIPNSVTNVGKEIFCACTGVEYLNIDVLPSLIGDNQNIATSLKTLIFGDHVTEIDHNMFQLSTELTSVTLGSSVTNVIDNAFMQCQNLSSIYLRSATPPTLGEDVFHSDAYEKAIVYVPEGSVDSYKQDASWSKFKNIREYDISGVDDVVAGEQNAVVVGYYNLQGVKSDEPWDGLNIVKYSDGTSRKVMHKK